MELRLTEERAEKLEEKLSWLEHTLLELDGVVRALQSEMVGLRRELAEVQVRQQAEPQDPEARRYEVPPHY